MREGPLQKELREIKEILSEFRACVAFERLRWRIFITCPRCHSENNYYRFKRESEKRVIFRCKSCKKEFSITTGTILENSHIPLRFWKKAAEALAVAKGGLSSHRLSKGLGITQKSAWFMIHRIRFAFKDRLKEKKGKAGGETKTVQQNKPLKLYPLTWEEIIRTLLNTPPIPKSRKKRSK